MPATRVCRRAPPEGLCYRLQPNQRREGCLCRVCHLSQRQRAVFHQARARRVFPAHRSEPPPARSPPPPTTHRRAPLCARSQAQCGRPWGELANGLMVGSGSHWSFDTCSSASTNRARATSSRSSSRMSLPARASSEVRNAPRGPTHHALEVASIEPMCKGLGGLSVESTTAARSDPPSVVSRREKGVCGTGPSAVDAAW